MKVLQQQQALYILSFISQYTISMVNLTLVYHLNRVFSLSYSMIGFAASIYTITYFLFCMLFHHVATYVQPHRLLILAELGMALSIGIIIFAKSVNLVFISLFLYGISMSLLWPQIESWICRGKEGRALNRATSSFNIAWSIGAAISPLITGFLVEYSTMYPLYLASIVFGANSLFVWYTAKKSADVSSYLSERESVSHNITVDRSTPLRYISWAGVLTCYVIFAILVTFFPLHATQHLHFLEREIGFLLLVRGVSTILTFILLGKSSWWHFNRGAIVMVQLGCAVLAYIFATISHFGLFILFFMVFGIFFALSYSFSIFHGASGSVHRSKRMMIHEALLTIGTILGSFFGGKIYQANSFALLLKYSAIMSLIPLVLWVCLFFLKKRKLYTKL